jgi:hypothetical protein
MIVFQRTSVFVEIIEAYSCDSYSIADNKPSCYEFVA